MTRPPGALVYSIGHSSLSSEELVEHLRRFDVRTLIDVRRYPGSRRHRQFGKNALEMTLRKASIDYEHLGGALGGYRDIPYERYIESDAFRAGLARLEARASESRSAFMCAEKNPWQCHRRFIASALEDRGWTVHHLVGGQVLIL